MEELGKNLQSYLLIGGGAYAVIEGLKQKGTTSYFLLGIGAFAIIKGLNQTKNTDSNLGAGNNPIPPNSGTVNNALVNSFVSSLHNSLNSWATVWNDPVRCNLLRDYERLNTANFIAVANKYFQTYKVTLKTELLSLWVDGCSIGEAPIPKIMQRFQELNII